MLSLDTHVLVYFLQGQLLADEDRALSREPWGISPIVLWELFDLAVRGRISLNVDDRALQRDLQQVPVLPLTVEVARIATRLDFRSDPVDEVIAATAIHYDARLVTRDARIRASKMVPFAT